jgi:hypothetical protein
VDLPDIARIETRRRDPGVKVVAKIVCGLGAPAARLLENVQYQPQERG